MYELVLLSEKFRDSMEKSRSVGLLEYEDDQCQLFNRGPHVKDAVYIVMDFLRKESDIFIVIRSSPYSGYHMMLCQLWSDRRPTSMECSETCYYFPSVFLRDRYRLPILHKNL